MLSQSLRSFVLLLGLAACALAADDVERRQLTSTAGVPNVPNVGTGAPVATVPDGLGGLSTGVTAQFTPGAASANPVSPFQQPTDAAGSASLASILTKYSQAMTAPTPTTGPPTGISSGLPGGFTGTGTTSVLDGRITTIDNAATTYTGPRPGSSSSAESPNQASFNSAPLKGMAVAAGAALLAGAVLI